MYWVYSTWSTFERRCASMLDIILAMVQKIDEQPEGIWITSKYVGDSLHWFCSGDLSDLGPRWEWRYLRSRADPGVDQTASWVNLGETKGKGKPTGRKQRVPTWSSDIGMMCGFWRYRSMYYDVIIYKIYILKDIIRISKHACCLYLESSIWIHTCEESRPSCHLHRRCTKESWLRPRIMWKVASRPARCPQRPTFS